MFLATPHPDGYIAVLPPSEVEKLHAKFSELKLSDAAAQAFAARFFSQTQSVSFDKAGRVMVSPDLLRHANIAKDAVLVGSLTKFNLYSPARWQQEEARTAGGNFGGLMRRRTLVFGSGILDSLANWFYVLAVREGLLSVVSVIVTLYPAATMVLAVTIDRERIHRAQMLGIVLAGAALTMIVLA